MRLLLWQIVLCGFLASSSFAQWTVLIERMDEQQNSFYFEHLSCSDDRNCTAIGFSQPFDLPGYRYTAWRTTDGGDTWRSQQLPTHPRSLWPIARLDKVHALDSLNILIVGDSGLIFRTKDAGETWVQQDTRQNWSYNDGRLLTPDLGYAVGYYGKIVKTIDGETWSALQSPSPNMLELVRPLSDSRLLVFDRFYGLQFSSSDGGLTWDTTQLYPDYFTGDTGKYIYDACFWDADNGVVAGGNWQKTIPATNLFMMRTKDGGRSWQALYDKTLATSMDAIAIDFLDSLNGVVGGGTTSIARTSDGGVSWRRDSAQFNRAVEQFTGVSMLSANKILATTVIAHVGNVVKFSPSLTVARTTATQGAQSLTVRGDELHVSRAGRVRVSDLLGRTLDVRNVEAGSRTRLSDLLPSEGAFIISFFDTFEGNYAEHMKLVVQ